MTVRTLHILKFSKWETAFVLKQIFCKGARVKYRKFQKIQDIKKLCKRMLPDWDKSLIRHILILPTAQLEIESKQTAKYSLCMS